jgi:hypothetical protein
MRPSQSFGGLNLDAVVIKGMKKARGVKENKRKRFG